MGKNDYKKGNRSNSKRNTDKIVSYNARYKEELDRYKAFAEARRNSRKYDQTSVGKLNEKLDTYVSKTWSQGRPLTVAGTILALGTDRETWRRAKDGELDYLLEEYIELNNIKDSDISYIDGLPYFIDSDGQAILLIPFSAIRQKSDLLIQAQLEENCYTNKGNPAGSIFALKAQFEWKEDNTPQNLTQTLVIADAEQARKALNLLK